MSNCPTIMPGYNMDQRLRITELFANRVLFCHVLTVVYADCCLQCSALLPAARRHIPTRTRTHAHAMLSNAVPFISGAPLYSLCVDMFSLCRSGLVGDLIFNPALLGRVGGTNSLGACTINIFSLARQISNASRSANRAAVLDVEVLPRISSFQINLACCRARWGC